MIESNKICDYCAESEGCNQRLEDYDCFIGKKLYTHKERISRVNISFRNNWETGSGEWAWKSTYCICCGAGVHNQKYCHNCGAKLDWEFRKTVPKNIGYWERVKYYDSEGYEEHMNYLKKEK